MTPTGQTADGSWEIGVRRTAPIEPRDWRVLNDGACAYFRTGSFAAGARLVEAIAALVDDRADVDLRQAGVTVRLVTSGPDFHGPGDIDLAERISAVARELDIPADPTAVQAIQLSIDVVDIPAARSFWQAALGYQNVNERLVDPQRRGVALRFQEMDVPRPLRNRIHLDLVSSYDVADSRRDAALAGGGRLVDAERPWVFADSEGNEICLPAAHATPRPADQHEGWDPALAQGTTEPVGVGWQQFHETDGVADWRMLDVGAAAYFRTGSFARGAQFASAICALDGLGNRRPTVDLRADGVTIRLMTITDTFGGPASQFDVELARRISAIAAGLDIAADPTALGAMLIAIDALDIPAVMPFWRAALGYEDRADTDQDLLDPHDRWPTFWFQHMDVPRDQRNRIRIDVSVPYDQAEHRIAAALRAGGRQVGEPDPRWTVLADPEGNEICVTACR